MDAVLVLIILIWSMGLAIIPVFCFFIFSEVKKIRKEMVKIEFSINQMKFSLAHQTSKNELMNKHLEIIGSKIAPERYKRRTSGKR